MCFIICTTTWCTCQWEVGIIGTTLVWRPIRTIPAMTYTRVRPYKLKTRNLLVRIFLIQHSTLTCWIGQVLGHSMTINWWTGNSPIRIWIHKQILLLRNTSLDTKITPKIQHNNFTRRIFWRPNATLTCWIGQVLCNSMTINWWTGTNPIGIWKHKKILL